MILRRIKHMLFRLSIEEKVLGLSALTVFVGTFLPWYTTTLYDEQTQIYTGFAGDLGVVGFIIFLFNIMILGFLIGEHLGIKIPNFGYKKEQILLFLSSQSAFLLLVTIAVYTKRSLDFTSSGIRFGLYVNLIGACIGAFAAFAQIKKLQTTEVENLFDHSEEILAEDQAKDVREDSTEYDLETPIDRSVNETRVEIKPKEDVEQKSFFYEEENIIEDPMSDSIEDSIRNNEENNFAVDIDHDSSDEDILDDDAVETQNFVPEKDEEDINLEIDKPHDQQNYFMRDAGLGEVTIEQNENDIVAETDALENDIVNTATEPETDMKDTEDVVEPESKSNIKVNMDSVQVVEKSENKSVETQDLASKNDKPEKKEPVNQNMSLDFYDDL